jgi:hypothetical protein
VKFRSREDEQKLTDDELNAFIESKETIPTPDDGDDPAMNSTALARQVYKRKGTWCQLPKDYPEPEAD